MKINISFIDLDNEIWIAENMEGINQIINETHTIFLENLDLKLGL
jgi:hypothetical protein